MITVMDSENKGRSTPIQIDVALTLVFCKFSLDRTTVPLLPSPSLMHAHVYMQTHIHTHP